MLDPKAELDMLRSYWINKRVLVKGPAAAAIIVGIFNGTEYVAGLRIPSIWFDAVYEKHIEEHRELQRTGRMTQGSRLSSGYFRFQLTLRDIQEELPDV